MPDPLCARAALTLYAKSFACVVAMHSAAESLKLLPPHRCHEGGGGGRLSCG